MNYLDAVRRGQLRGTNYEHVNLIAHQIIPKERRELEKIAKKSYTLAFLGYHIHSEDDKYCQYRGIKNKVKFVQDGKNTCIYIYGPHATEIGKEIEDLPFVEFSPSKEQVIYYDLEDRIL